MRAHAVVRGLLSAAIVAGLAACATVDSRSREDVVKERAQARWDALVKSDVKSAYELMSPGSRTVTSYNDYLGSINPGFWKSALVREVKCEGPDSCEVVATIEYEFQGKRIKTPLRETWIRDGSNWWFVKK